MVVNTGAYSTEIIRAGIQVTPKGQWEAGRVLGLTRLQTFIRVVLPPALQRIYPALVSQCIIVMLGSSVVSQVSYEELTFAANLIQSRTFLSFEVYLVTTGIYLALSITLRQLMMAAGRKWLGCRHDDHLYRLGHYSQPAAGRTLDGTAVAGGVCRRGCGNAAAPAAAPDGRTHGEAHYPRLYRAVSGHPAADAAVHGLLRRGAVRHRRFAVDRRLAGVNLYTSAFLLDIWYGSIRALPKGQWEASRCLGLTFGQTLFRVVAPQALRIGIAPTVGFAVQVIKGTALASIIGFIELTKAGTMLTNVTYQPFKVFALVALGYFILCYPLSRYSRYLETKFNASHHH